MTRDIRIIREASVEFTEAVLWYEERRPGLGAEFFDAVCTTLDLIAAGAEIGAPVLAETRERRVLMSRFPYQVVYRVTTSEVVIVAVAHLRRRPGYWKSRP